MSFFGEPPDFDFSLSSTLAHNWKVVLARGIFGLLIGLIAFLFPGPTLLSLVGLFAAYLIIDGILAIVAAVHAAQRNQRWGWLTFEGIAGILAGVIALALPGLTVLVFVGLLAAWAIVSGALELRAAYQLATDHGRLWLILGGIISIIFGIVLIAAPVFGALVVSWWVGAYATFFGATLIAMAFKLRARDQTPGSSQTAGRM
ncbi:MAG: HdeD family acid-resistance protein [Alphaproteobacteria bacterium]|nr:HdeD family acid-resistance protein [Alphaproteobacteria bacterium]